MSNPFKKPRLDKENDKVCPTGAGNTGDANVERTDSKRSSPGELVDQSATGSEQNLQPGLARSIKPTTRDDLTDDFQDLAKQTRSGHAAANILDEQKGLQKDLIEYYQHQHSMTSVSPLVEEHVVPLVELYVKPPLVAVDLQHPYGNPTKTSILNYEHMFCQGLSKVHKNIYVTSSAGMGKTSFCKHICMAWCQAHNPLRSMNNKFKPEDIRTLHGFEFLFYITMRDVPRSQCHLEKLIEALITENLPKRSNQPLHQILDDNPCLVVVDGLDEWVHPKTCDRRKTEHDIPHTKYRKNWTILTTTRSWKFDIIHLPSNHIDSHIELTELDKRSSNELVKNAINVLNIKFKSRKTVEEFYKTTSHLKLGEICKIPYLHLHCVCLWYDGRDIGNSKCEIYSNILKLTLNRGTQKLQLVPVSVTTLQESSDCMEGNEYRSLLLKIGKLAFYAIFGSGNRQMLVIDYKFATNYLKPEELKYCLKLGLLSQNKVYGPISRRISNVSFQHKTIQEYLAAFYMQSTTLDPNSSCQNIHELVVQTCTTLSHILEMSEVFIFLGGFSSTVFKDISWKLIKTVNEDTHTQRYRTFIDYTVRHNEYNTMFKYQSLLVDCLEEMQLNGQDFRPLPLEDVMINQQSKRPEYMSYIQKLVQGNNKGIKSLNITDCENTEEVTYILNRLNLQYFHCLEKLHLRCVPRQADVETLLNQSVKTLHCLALHNANYKQGRYFSEMTALSPECLDTIVNMSLLKSLCLNCLVLTHAQLENVTTFLTTCVTISQIHLDDIACSDHKKFCPGVQFHLSAHTNLQQLGLVDVPVSLLKVNAQHLEVCHIGRLPSKVISYWLTCLPAAHNLHTLYCRILNETDIPTLIATVPALVQLENLYIQFTDIGDNRLVMITDMTKLKRIVLYEVSMKSSSFQALVDSISPLSQSVKVHLVDCTVTPKAEYETVVGHIRKSDRFTVIFDGMNRRRQLFQFQTVEKNSIVTCVY